MNDSHATKFESAALLAALVESSYDAIVSKDLDSIITSWNPAAERMFGFTAAEAIGQSVLMIIPANRQSEEVDIIARVRQGQRVEPFDTIRQRKDGTLFPVSITVSPVLASDGTVAGASKIARDISARRESERKIQLLLREVNHRVKNQLSVVLSVIRETERRANSIGDFADGLRHRIQALARSQDLLVRGDWGGATILDLVKESLLPFGHEERVRISGPELSAGAPVIQVLGMVFHELGTNSVKYGALSDEKGNVLVEWSLSQKENDEPAFFLVWQEDFTPKPPEPQSPPPSAKGGFGSVVLRRVAPQALSGEADLTMTSSSLRWTLKAPLREILPRTDTIE